MQKDGETEQVRKAYILANNVLKQYLVKGYAIDTHQANRGDGGGAYEPERRFNPGSYFKDVIGVTKTRRTPLETIHQMLEE